MDAGPLNDIFSFEGGRTSWNRLEVSGKIPPPRHSHSLIAVGTKIYLFGGHDGSTWLNDLYAFDTGDTGS